MSKRAALAGAVVVVSGLTAAWMLGGDDGRAAPPPPASFSAAEVVELARRLDGDLSAHLRSCMSAAGYPELADAAGIVERAEPEGRRIPLRADPLEAGPYTEEQAERHGIMGTAHLFRTDEPAFVISESDEYDSALRRCHKEFDDSRGASVSTLVGSSSELTDDMHRDFLDLLDEPVGELISSRLDCVRENGYASLTRDPRAATVDLLASIDIAPGPERSASLLSVPERRHSGVFLSPPQPTVVYTPSPEEVRFAVQYVRCGRQQEFAERWAEVQVEPRRVVTERYAGELAALGGALVRAGAA